MKLKVAVEEILREAGRAVVTEYELSRIVLKLYLAGEYKSQQLNIKKRNPTADDVRAASNRLDYSVVKPDSDFGPGSGVFRVPSVPDQSAEDICCIVDPFCYVSHLSAMQRHGLTNRLPIELSITTHKRKIWNGLRDRVEAAELETLPAAVDLPRLTQIQIPEKVRKRPINRHQSVLAGGSQTIRDSNTRVSTIGRTFLDMLLRPDWCGGMSHVLDVWENNARDFLDEIIEAIDGAPKKLIRVRAGYILEERLGINDPRIEKWLADTQRGGSQVLNPEKPYSEPFSLKWMLSINV